MNRPLVMHWAFIVGLIGGILIVLGGVLMTFMMSMMNMMMGSMPMGDSSMADHMGGMWGAWTGMGLWMLVWSALTGTLVLVGSLQFRAATPNVTAWAVAVIVAGILSFPTMGGFLVGALAAVASGILALVSTGPAAIDPPATGPPAA